jgi:hypothetical protein
MMVNYLLTKYFSKIILNVILLGCVDMITRISVVLLIFISSVSMNGFPGPNNAWGSLLPKIKSTLPPGTEFVEFTPGERPKYKNRILSYITAIDNKLVDKIIILRVKTRPETDYLFVNNKLYSIIENWDDIDQNTEKEIQVNLKKQFGESRVQKDKNFYIYSYDGDNTKVLWYLMKAPGKKSACKIYYYTRQLFRLLISE